VEGFAAVAWKTVHAIERRGVLAGATSRAMHPIAEGSLVESALMIHMRNGSEGFAWSD
jgi:hypothetical protein